MASQSINFRPTSMIKQLPWRIDRNTAIGLLLILGTFSLVGWLYLGQASLVTSSTMNIERLQQEIELLEQKNSELALDIAELESIERIEVRATQLGLAPTEPSRIRYMTINQPAAPAQPTAPPQTTKLETP